ncbi:hypothetical protein BDP81DRAFT_140789 [Colletotrichum phormii]|uniref:Uncharacterized protein n=1 Tax=Colletotrichum phormii TaxID=359342 RepID=A0AAI9ZE74_9PEZI|nr:uncharacterized protein BDP81DRAFT_140789 [Colletotrichum phormii]KAK1622898.1 hypothetical protein BDP81DRAFT_140789 [Colletotrichum phormii]
MRQAKRAQKTRHPRCDGVIGDRLKSRTLQSAVITKHTTGGWQTRQRLWPGRRAAWICRRSDALRRDWVPPATKAKGWAGRRTADDGWRLPDGICSWRDAGAMRRTSPEQSVQAGKCSAAQGDGKSYYSLRRRLDRERALTSRVFEQIAVDRREP